jgi:hypothetical protein
MSVAGFYPTAAAGNATCKSAEQHVSFAVVAYCLDNAAVEPAMGTAGAALLVQLVSVGICSCWVAGGGASGPPWVACFARQTDINDKPAAGCCFLQVVRQHKQMRQGGAAPQQLPTIGEAVVRFQV